MMDTRLSLPEVQALLAREDNPDDFIALPVTITLGAIPPMIATTPSGTEIVVIPMQLVLPAELLNVQRIADAQGRRASPVDGMLPAVNARLVLPKARLSEVGVARIGEPRLRIPED